MTQKSPLWLTVLSLSFLVLWLALASVPFIWTLWGSFKVEADFFSRLDWRNAIYGVRTLAETGGTFTGGGYEGAWVKEEFWKAALNTGIMTLSVVAISLTLGTLGGYALARSGFRYAFWILVVALVFRAMPHITLVSGYLLPFFEMNLWGHLTTTIIVMVAINQPFTLWMLHSFFLNIPKDLDESAMVDGCTRFQAFRYVIWPQALRRMIPPLGNQGIISIKDTSLFSVIGVSELVRQGQIYIATTFTALEVYFMVALMYLAITWTLSLVLRQIERRGLAGQ